MVRKIDTASSFSTLSVSFDTLLELQQDFRQLFAWAQKNRYDSVTVMLGGYSHIKAAKKLFDALVNYRYTPSKLGMALINGIQKLNLLFHNLSTESRNEDPSDRPLRRMLSALLDKLGSLLPRDAGVQLLLFDEDEYQQEGWVKPTFPGFRRWACIQLYRVKEFHSRFTTQSVRQLSLALNAVNDSRPYF